MRLLWWCHCCYSFAWRCLVLLSLINVVFRLEFSCIDAHMVSAQMKTQNHILAISDVLAAAAHTNHINAAWSFSRSVPFIRTFRSLGMWALFVRYNGNRLENKATIKWIGKLYKILIAQASSSNGISTNLVCYQTYASIYHCK